MIEKEWEILSNERLDVVVTTVINEYKWSPDKIGDLFFDAQDYLGLFHWYKLCLEQHKKIKNLK